MLTMSVGVSTNGRSRKLTAGTRVGVRLSGRLVAGTVLDRIGPSGSVEPSELSLVRVRLGDETDPDAPTLDVPSAWLEDAPSK